MNYLYIEEKKNIGNEILKIYILSIIFCLWKIFSKSTIRISYRIVAALSEILLSFEQRRFDHNVIFKASNNRFHSSNLSVREY